MEMCYRVPIVYRCDLEDISDDYPDEWIHELKASMEEFKTSIKDMLLDFKDNMNDLKDDLKDIFDSDEFSEDVGSIF